MNEDQRVAVVTGANRGIGYEICRQLAGLGHRVVLTSRDEAAGRAAVARLRGDGRCVVYHLLDVTDRQHIAQLTTWLSDELGRVDVLVNNAGIFPEGKSYPQVVRAMDADLSVIRRTLETNTLGHLALCQAVIPIMTARRYGRIVIMSSVSGRLSDMGPGMPGYRMSHVANNALARILGAELEGTNVLVNAVCPYWVKTRMGGPQAPRSVAEGAETPVWLATLPDGGPSGGFFRDKEQLEW